MAELPRRHFVRLVVGAVTLGGPLAACSQGVGPAAVGDVPAGNVSGLPVGTLRGVGGEAVCIGRDAGGVYAMTLTCTHQGCDMAQQGNVDASGVSCACHGSQFDANGNVVRGPASAGLQHFAVSASASGDLTIHGGTDVDASVRLKV